MASSPFTRRAFLKQTAGWTCASALGLSLSTAIARAADAPAPAAGSVLDPNDPIGKLIRFRPGHYLDMPVGEGNSPERFRAMMDCVAHPGIRGTDYRFTWRSLEKSKDNYDFAAVDRVFARAEKIGKPTMIFLGDKSFSKDGVDVPDYIATDYDGVVRLDMTTNSKPILRGGGGSLPRRWDPRVNERYLKLLRELGRRYDSNPLFECLLLQETHTLHFLVGADYSTEKHLAAIHDRLRVAREALPHTQVCQYTNANFDANIKGPARFVGEYLREIRGMLGAPDILPFQPTQAKELHPYYEKYHGIIPLCAAMQNDSFRHTEPHSTTTAERAKARPVPMTEMVDFALNKMHLNHIVWNYVGARGESDFTSDFPHDALAAISGRSSAFDRPWKFTF